MALKQMTICFSWSHQKLKKVRHFERQREIFLLNKLGLNVINLSKVLVPMRRIGTPPCLRCRPLQTTDINDSTWMRRIQDAFPCTAWERDKDNEPVKSRKGLI